jgi:hypothetical protein
MLIAANDPVITYGPLLPLGVPDAGGATPASLRVAIEQSGVPLRIRSTTVTSWVLE